MSDEWRTDTRRKGIPFLRSQNIAPFRIDLEDIKYVPRSFHESLRKSALKPGDVAVVRTGYPGTACVIPESLKESNCADLVVITPSQRLNPYYLAAIFNSAWGKASVGGNLVGVAQQHFNVSAAREMEISLPSRPIQDRIVNILSAYDELIENNQRRIRILEEMARTLYREWFVNFRFPGHEKVPLVDSPIGPIPKGWELKTLKELCSKLIDGTHDSPKPSESGYPLVTGRHIKNGFIDFSETYLISEDEHQKVMKRSRPEKGDIIYSNIGTLGEATLVDQNFEYSIKNVALFKPLNASYSPFLYCYLADPDTLRLLQSKASGTSQKFFSLEFLRATEVIVPSNYLVYLFASKISPILECRSALNKRNQNLRRTRELLLPRLISGEILLNHRHTTATVIST